MTPETLKEIHTEYLQLRADEKLMRERQAHQYSAYLATQGRANNTQSTASLLETLLRTLAPELLDETAIPAEPALPDVFAGIEE